MQSALMRTDKALLLVALQIAGANIDRPNSIRCPFHDDRTPSAGVYLEKDGHWAFKCHGCGFQGDLFDVRSKANGTSVADELRSVNDDPPAPMKPKFVHATLNDISTPGKREACYTYANPQTVAVEMAVIRWVDSSGKKKFLQCRPVDGGFVCEAPPKPWPIYNRARVAKAGTVVVVEGEKCVHSLHQAGFVATTSPGGAGKAQYADWSPLAGKRVILWPDNDSPDDKGVRKGIAHMHDVRRELEGLNPKPTVLWLDPDALDLPDKGDVVDFIASGRDVLDALSLAQSTGAAAEVKALIDDTASGRRRAIEWPWPVLSFYTKALYPQTITLLCGDPGCAKSFMILQSAIYWHENNVPVALLELEEPRAWHNLRALALRSGVKEILNDAWVRDKAGEAQHVYELHQDFLDSFGHCIHDAQEQFTLDDVTKWIAARAMEGARIIVVDPITAVATPDKQWIADAKFVIEAKKIVEQFDCSLILVTHPRKGIKGGSQLEDMAGGAAYARFAQCVLWLKRHRPLRECTVKRSSALGGIREVVSVDRTLSICKARHGNGTGLELAFHFEGESLSFQDCGVIVKDESHESN